MLVGVRCVLRLRNRPRSMALEITCVPAGLAGLSIQAGLLLSLSKAGRHESLAGHQTVEAENIFQLETKNSTRKDRKTEIHSTSNARLLETRT